MCNCIGFLDDPSPLLSSFIFDRFFMLAKWVLIIVFCFLLSFFPDGHELASRLSKVIQRETEAVKSALSAFNGAPMPSMLLLSDPPAHISWSDITDTTSVF